MKITSTFSFKSQIIDSSAQPSATVVLPSVDPVKNDTFESQEKTDKSKRKKHNSKKILTDFAGYMILRPAVQVMKNSIKL